MKNINKITYFDIKNLLISNNINPESDLLDSDFFTSLNSLTNANENELTFFNDISQLKKLEKTKAKACLINNKYLKFLPNSTSSILVEDSYKSFAIISNLFAVKEKGETPKFPTNTKTKISNYNSLRLYILVYEYQLKYPAADTYEISQRIQKRESFKRYPVPSFTDGLSLDGEVINKRTVLRKMSNYKKRGKEVMENICNGVFP